MTARIWLNKASGYKEAGDFERKYYAQMTPQQRLKIVHFLRESWARISGKHARNKRLQRSYKIIKQA